MMKCGNYAKFAIRKRKGSGAEYEKAVDVRSFVHFQHQHEDMIAQGYVLCDGDVSCSKIEAEDEPYFGGHNASLEVEHKCSRCETTFHPELDKLGIVELANKGINSITPEEQTRLRDQWLAEHNRIYGQNKTISYAHRNGPNNQRFRQLASLPVPKWAVDVREGELEGHDSH